MEVHFGGKPQSHVKRARERRERMEEGRAWWCRGLHDVGRLLDEAARETRATNP